MGVFSNTIAAVTAAAATVTSIISLYNTFKSTKEQVQEIKQELSPTDEAMKNYTENLPTEENIKGLTADYAPDSYTEEQNALFEKEGRQAAVIHEALAQCYGEAEIPEGLRVIFETGEFANTEPGRVGYMMNNYVEATEDEEAHFDKNEFGQSVDAFYNKIVEAQASGVTLTDDLIRDYMKETKINEKSAFIKAYEPDEPTSTDDGHTMTPDDKARAADALTSDIEDTSDKSDQIQA